MECIKVVNSAVCLPTNSSVVARQSPRMAFIVVSLVRLIWSTIRSVYRGPFHERFMNPWSKP